MTNLLTFQPPIKVETVQPLNRAARRATTKRRPGRRPACTICGGEVVAKDVAVANDKMFHRACLDKHNERAEEIARDAIVARVQAGGLILPGNSLLVPPHAARR